MEGPNVYYDGGENRQAKRNESADQEKQSTDELKTADDVNVAAREKRVQIFTSYTLRQRRHGKEMQETVRTKENEN